MSNFMYKTFSLSTTLVCFFTFITALTVYSLLCADILDQKIGFTILTLLLLTFLVVEINYLRTKHTERWLFNPVVLCSIMTFFLYYVFTNLLYYLPEEEINIEHLSNTISLVMNKMMFIVIIAAIALWLGYWSPIVGYYKLILVSMDIQVHMKIL